MSDNHPNDDEPRQDEHDNELPPTNDPSAPQGEDEDFSTIDSSIQPQPDNYEDVADQTIDSSIQKRPTVPTGPEPECPPSDVSTILPLEDDIDTMEGVDDLPPQSPERIAGFRLLGVIGVGGMGKVYLAVQDRPRRHVALKVMKGGAISEQAMRRFEFEAELLARLVHPGISQIYEAGSYDDGDGAAPYFAMEYVASARTMTASCRERKLDTRQIAALMAEVCDAVGFGHTKGIIHRDLKPGNILINSGGDPKIIDFGVARSTDSDKSVTMQTDVHAIVGTLQYMAPEQCTGDVLDLDTSADVYALGVTLYQLLTGKLPYEVSGQALTTAIRIVAETIPERISAIDKSLAGDLDVIVQKTLSKDRADRYRTAADLGDDLRRWLNDEPISAAPPTLMVLLRRAVRRNKGLVAAAAGMVALLAMAIVIGVFALVARNDALEAKAGILLAENDLLEEQAQKREMVGGLIAHFMSDTFKIIAPLSGSQGAREGLINVSLEYIARLRDQAHDDPSMQRLLAEGLQQAGINQWSMTSGNRGRMDEAIASYEESVELADDLRSQDDTDMKSKMLAVRGRLLLYNAYRRQGRAADQVRMLDEAEPLLDGVDLETAPLDYARSVVGIRLKRAAGSKARPDNDPTLIALLDVVERMLARFPDNRMVRRDATIAWNFAGYAWSSQGEHEESLKQYERSLRERESILGHAENENTARRDVLLVHRYVSEQKLVLGRLTEVVDAYELDIVPLARAIATDSPNDNRARKDLAKVLAEHGEVLLHLDRDSEAVKPLAESRAVWDEAIEVMGGDISADYWTTRAILSLEISLAHAYVAAGQLDEARVVAERGVALGRKATTSWPEMTDVREQYNSVRRLRAKILEQAN
jgi:tRNA A-37 threonylcarbamoyl transferase component Bud32/tetratricopeptide (TPR) repeat protein